MAKKPDTPLKIRKIHGFTLVELIVVITILAILATVGFLALSGYTQDARDSAIKANVRSLQTAITSEAAVTNQSPRYYVIHDADYALSGAFAYVDSASVALTGGDVGQAPLDSNYTAGKPDFKKLKLNPEKFRISASGLPGGTFGVLARATGFGASGFGAETADASYDASSLMAAWADFVTTGANGKKRAVSYVQAAGISPASKVAVVAGNFPTSNSQPGTVSWLLRAEPGSATNLTGTLTDGASFENPVTVPSVVNVVWNDSVGRNWSDGTYAASCSGYLNAPAGKTYAWTTWNGAYLIDPDGVGGNAAYLAYCDMTTLWGGWTLVMNVDTSDGNVMHYENLLWTNASSIGSVPASLTNANDYKNGTAFSSFAGNQLMVSLHTEWTPYVSRSYALNESSKTLSYYFNKGSNIQLTSSVLSSSVTTLPSANEPISYPNSNLYVNTGRGIGDLDRLSVGWTIADNNGGGIGTWYDSNVDRQRPRADAQLLGCHWAVTTGCRIGSDYDSANANATWNASAGLAYDYAFYVR